MNCPKCGAQLPDGAKFCGSCGARLTEPTQTIVARKPTAPVVQAPEEVAVQPDQGAAAAKKSKLPLLIVAIVAVVLAVLAVVFFVLPNLGGSSKNAYVALQDGKYELLPSLSKTDTVEIASAKTEEDKMYWLDGEFSPDGKYFYYITKADDKYGTLNRAEYGKLKDGSDKNDKYITTIATNVLVLFTVMDDGVVYKNADNKLYYYDGSQPVTLGKDVSSYTADSEKNRVMYYTADDNGDYTLYFVDLKKPDESTKLVSGVDSVVSSDNLDHILYSKDNGNDGNALYSVDTAGNTEKITNDYEYVHDAENEMYYLAAADETYSPIALLSDADNYSQEPRQEDYSVPSYDDYYFYEDRSESDYDVIVGTCSQNVVFFSLYDTIEDMQYSSDSAVALACKSFVDKYSSQEDDDGYFPMTDAVKADLITIAQACGQYGENAWHELCVARRQDGMKTDYDAYYKAQDLYLAAQAVKEEKDPLYNLYKFSYSDGKSTVVAENILSATRSGNAIFYFGPEAFNGTITVEESMDDGGDGYFGALTSLIEPTGLHLYCIDTGKTVSLSQASFETLFEQNDMLNTFAMVDDYLVSGDSYEDTLYTAKINNGSVEGFDILSDDAAIASVVNGVVYYTANQYDSNGTTYADLYTYANGKSSRVTQDVTATYALLYEDGQLLVRTEYNNYDDYEIAMIAKDGTRTVIADGVSWFRRTDKNTLLYISDNDLYCYDGKEKTRLLTDVDRVWCRSAMSASTISMGY